MLLNLFRKKTFLISFGLILFLFSALTVFGNEGLLKLKELVELRDKVRKENSELAQKNQSLNQELSLLKEPAYQQQMIREKLGYVKKGEYVLLLNDQENTSTTAASVKDSVVEAEQPLKSSKPSAAASKANQTHLKNKKD